MARGDKLGTPKIQVSINDFRQRCIGSTSLYQIRKFNRGHVALIKVDTGAMVSPSNGDRVLVNNRKRMETDVYVFVYDDAKFHFVRHQP